MNTLTTPITQLTPSYSLLLLLLPQPYHLPSALLSTYVQTRKIPADFATNLHIFHYSA